MDQVQEETIAAGHKAQEDDHSVEKANIEVYFRLRPMNKLELSRRSRHCVEISSSDSRENDRVTIDSPLDGTFDFDFDRVSIIQRLMISLTYMHGHVLQSLCEDILIAHR